MDKILKVYHKRLIIVLKQQKDPVDDYFDCVSSCDTDNKECHDECIEELKENDTGD